MYLICYLFIFRLCSIYRVGFSLLLRVHILGTVKNYAQNCLQAPAE